MISKEINLSSPTSDGGFYYDEQLGNEIYRATLHPSTEPGPADEYSKETSKELSSYYRKDPIATAIISEDFQVSIANTFTDFGGDALGSFWNDMVKPLQPYVSEVEQDLGTILEKGGALVDNIINKIGNDDIKKAIDKVKDIGSSIVGEVKTNPAAIMKRSLVVQGTMFKYFSGTGVDFGNLMMKYVVFSGYDKDGTYHRVQDEIEKLRFYMIGDMVDLGGGLSEDLKKFVRWQLPPGGYKTNIMNVDEKQYGTLLLKLGPFYSIPNLVIQGAQLNYSKTMAKNPSTGDSTELDPLYCEVTLMLKPVTKFSAKALFNFAHGRDSAPERKEFEKGTLASRLTTLKSKANGMTVTKM